MNLLQSEIVDEKKVRLEFFKSKDAGSMAVVGLGGGTPSSSLLQSVHTPARTELPNIFTTNFDELLNSEFRQAQARRLRVASLVVRQPTKSRFRNAELEWRRTHLETLKSLENQWVVVEGTELVAHGRDPVAVIKEAKSKGVRTPYIFFVEPPSDNSFKIGL
jgi:hypothetical protein